MLVAAGCGSSSAAHSASALSPAQAIPSPSASSMPSPSPPPSPTPEATPKAAAAPAQSIPVSFAGLGPGAYPTHLHSACTGLQSYHILVLQTLVVGGNGAGTVQVPSAYFGRGLCIIVYTSPSLTRVYTTRRI